MQNRKLFFIAGAVLLVVGAAAFMAGRLLNRDVLPLGLFGPQEDELSILPAEELPETPSEVNGLVMERQDNIIIIETDQILGNEASGSPVGIGGGPREEVVITAETKIYYDTTQPPARRPTGDDPRVLQQTVEEGTLDDLNISHSFIMVWGQRTGDRIIADVLVYSNFVTIQSP